MIRLSSRLGVAHATCGSLVLALLAVPVAGCSHPGPPPAQPVAMPHLSSAQVGATARPAAPIVNLTSPGPREVPTLDRWASRYPDAARELGEWILAHRETARALAEWQRAHPEQMEALVDWTATNPVEPLSVLFFDRSGWGDFRAIAGANGEADGFVDWVRHAPHAAREMAFYGNGLAFLDREAATLVHASYSAVGMHDNPLFRGNASH